MTNEMYGARVRPLDESGRPIEPRRPIAPDSRRPLLVGAGIGLLALIAIGAVVAWRTLVGSPFGAAEAVPADADVVITVDFLQIRDVERVDRLVRAFAEPMARHGLIDDVPDLEGALREFDDVAEQETGFRFGEDVLGWIGRTASIGVWIPESALALDPFAEPAPPVFLATVEVRDQDRATDFLERVIAEAERSGVRVQTAQISGGPAYWIEADEEPVVVALQDGRFVIGDSTDSVRRALELDPADSVAQTDDFQRLASAVGGDPVVTYYGSASLGEKMTRLSADLGAELPFADQLRSAGMAAFFLDDDGIAMRAATSAFEDLTVRTGTAATALPAGTYGFVDVVLPDGYVGELSDLYLESLRGAGLRDEDVAMITEPADEVIGMSLLDDLLPQFGGELLLAVAPANDGMLAQETGVDIGGVFGLGVQDGNVVQTALDRTVDLLTQQGLVVRDQAGMRVLEVEGSDLGALALDSDSLYVASSPTLLQDVLSGNGTLGATDRYRRIDDLVGGDGLAFYVDVAGIAEDFVTDDQIRDVVAPLLALGAGYEVQGDLQITDFRLLIDY